MRSADQEGPVILGWHEPLALPDFGVVRAFAKLDTGADHSVLHAQSIIRLSNDEVEFALPLLLTQISCEEFVDGGQRRVRAKLVDERIVRSSTGHDQVRPVIETTVDMAGMCFLARLSLTDRRGLRFPILLGRSALCGRILVDSRETHASPGEDPCPAADGDDTISVKR